MDILTLAMAKSASTSTPGEKGDTGNGIKSTIMNDDYTLTIEFTDDTSYTTPSIRGEKGDKGDTPVKGIDYFTEEETAEIAEEASNKITVPTKTSQLTNDSNYVVAPATASVGQVLIVKAVDKNGVPTEFEAADKTGGTESNENVKLPKDENGNVLNGETGQFAVSDGNGGISWTTLEMWQGGSY